MRTEDGEAIISKIVEGWSKVYTKQISALGSYANILQYEVEFSLPTQTKPIPDRTVRVSFSIIQHNDGNYDIEFNFESESLKHKLNNTMRTNMFEQWIGRILENKHKIKQELHLGTEFEYTRQTDKHDKPSDPFCPAFDIQKIKLLTNHMDKSQKINVDSPRFISTLERAIIKLFKDLDPEDKGVLTYTQFFESFKDLKYDLTENDVRAMIALAAENEERRIPW